MAALTAPEVESGLVAWLDQATLNHDARVVKSTPHPGEPEPRPFVCFRVDGATSHWAPVTTSERKERLYLNPEWRSGGGPGWEARDQYLVDGANTYVGPTTAFLEASHGDWTEEGARMRLSEAGLAAVATEVERQKRRTIASR